MNGSASPEDLARRSASGDAEATFLLALKHLQGNGAPQDEAAAHRLLRKAGEQGHAIATRVRAHLIATGIGVPADFDKAKRLLTKIAGRDQHAATQLDMLKYVADPVAPIRHVVNRGPDVILVERLLAPEECQYLISIAQPKVQPAYVGNPESGGLRLDPVRTSYDSRFGPGEEDLVLNRINRRIAKATGTRYECGEPVHILRYSPGQDYKPHFDTIAGATNQRVWTALVYLNHGYGGGETDFPRLDIRVEGFTGDALLFCSVDRDGRPDPRTEHAGLPVTSGTKWLLSRWIRQSRYDPLRD